MALMDGPGYGEALTEFYRVLKPAGRLYFSITHPCFMTRHLGWVPAEGELPTRLTVGEYFNVQPEIETWHFSTQADHDKYPPFSVPTFYRTLSEYINGVAEAGFRLRSLFEPRPTAAGCRQRPSLERWCEHAAMFLHIDAVKDEG